MWFKYYDSTGAEIGRVNSRQITALQSSAVHSNGMYSIQGVAGSGTYEVSLRVYATAADALAAIDPLLASAIEN